MSIKQTDEDIRQLNLFQSFYGPNTTHSQLSNIIDIWDAAPKYVTPRRNSNLSVNTLDQVVERTFEFKGDIFRVRTAAAAFKNTSGKTVVKLPTAREELIEDVLRKIAVQQKLASVGITTLSTGEEVRVFNVKFSLYMLRNELAKYGHSIKYADLIEALMIMSGSVVEIAYSNKRTAIHRAAILTSLTGVSRDDLKNSPDSSLWEACFHPMVVYSLGSIEYRQYDYSHTMCYRSSLARWIHKRLSMVYSNAGMLHPYKLKLSSARNNSGIINHASIRHQARAVDEALDEMKSRHVVRLIERQQIIEGRKIQDVEYIIHPTPEFIALVKAANARQRDARNAINQPTKVLTVV